MRVIMDGKVYDTECADLIAEHSNCVSCGDAKFVSEKLYRSQRGTWFIHGRGGGLSPYRRELQGAYCEGEKIMPLSDDEAFAWLQQHEFYQIVEDFFHERLSIA